MTKKLTINKFILFSWLIILITYRTIICFSFRPELSNGESNNIWKAINVAKGEKLYNNPEHLPLDVLQYTPISEIPIIIFAKICNNKSENYIYQITVLGRFFQFICNIILAYMLFITAFKLLKINKTNAIYLTFSVLTSLTFTAFTIRPDALALVFLFCTVYFYLKFIIESQSFKWLLLTAIFLILSFYTKQDGIFLSLPIGIHLLCHKNIKALSRLVLYSIVLLAITLMCAYLLTNGLFFKNTILGLKNTTSIYQMISVFDKAYSIFGLFICFGLILGVYYFISFKNSLHNFLGIVCIFYFFLAVALSTKIGSWINYYTPFITLSIVLFFVYFKDKTLNSFSRYMLNALIIIFSMISLGRQVYNYTMPYLKLSEYKDIYKKEYALIENLKNTLKIKKSDIIIAPDHLHRNFLAENIILVNIEYYNQASYKYLKFKNNTNKNIKHIIFKTKDIETIHFLSNYFKIDLTKYNKSESMGVNVFSLIKN